MNSTKENLKILIATGIYPPDIGGPATHISQFIDFIKDKEFNFKIITFSDSDKGDINIFRILRKQNIFKKFFKYFFCIFKNIKDIDIIYLHDVSMAGLAVFLAAFLFRKKYILRMGGDFIWEQAYQAHKTTLKYKDFQREKTPCGFKLRSFIAKTIAKRAAKIIVPSNFLKDIIILWGIDSSKIVVVYNAISDCFAEVKSASSIYEKIDNFKKQNYKIFISNGRFVNWKKFDYLIEVFKDINNAKLFIIGDGPEKNNLIDLISKNNLKDKIFLLNKIPRQELLKLYEISDFFILFSIGDTFSFSCLEAFLCGLNLVIPREGAFEEIFSEFKDRGVKFIDLDDKNDVIKIINDTKIYKIQQGDIENLKSKYNYIKSFNSICNIILEIKKDENF
ncbi:MAG: glycosyltransferase family 4 protein [Patescibacteria group bacterium]|jgi:glycosyltransferase involved in cell wall biosynthesis